jgi:hypothetical protein
MNRFLKWFHRSHRTSRRTLSRSPRLEVEALEKRDLLSTLTFNGGPVLTNVRVETIYLGQDWGSSAGLGYLQPGQTPTGGFNAQEQIQQIDTYLNSIVHSSFLDMLGSQYSATATNGITTTTYNIGRGMFAGHYIDTTNLGSAVGTTVDIGEDKIRNIIEADINSGDVPVPYANSNMLYYVYLPPNVTPEAYDDKTKLYDSAFQGGHSSFTDASGRTVFYAIIQNPVGTYNGTGWATGLTPFQAQTTISSHELAEAVTDPIIGQGWYDSADAASGANEIGDLAGNWLVARQSNYSQFGILNGYTIQKEWSNSQQTGILPSGAAPTTPQSGITPSSLATFTDVWGNAYIFGLGTNGNVSYNEQGFYSTWSGWTSIGAPSGFAYSSILHTFVRWQGAKSISVTNDGSVWRVFAIGLNNAVYTFASGDTGWTSLGGQARQVTAGHRADGRLEVFAIGTDNVVYSDIRTGTGSGGWAGTTWAALVPSVTTGAIQAQQIVVDSASGREQVFVVGLDNSVHTTYEALAGTVRTGFTWNWMNWIELGVNVKSIAVEMTADGREEVFAIDTQGYVDSIRQDAPFDWTTSYFSRLGANGVGQTAQSLTVGRTYGGLEEVFAIDGQNNVVALAQTAPNDGWTDSSWFKLGFKATQVALVMNHVYQWGLNGAAYGDLTLAAISGGSVLTAQQTISDGGWF